MFEEKGAARVEVQDDGPGLDTERQELVPLQNGWKENVELLERALVERALAAAQGNKSKAAEILGIHRRLLYEKLRQYGVDQGNA